MTLKEKMTPDVLPKIFSEVEIHAENCVEIANEHAIEFARFYHVEKLGETKENYKSAKELLDLYNQSNP